MGSTWNDEVTKLGFPPHFARARRAPGLGMKYNDIKARGRTTLLTGAVCAALGLFATACDRHDEPLTPGRGSAEEVGEAIDKAADDAADSVRDAARDADRTNRFDRVGEAVEDAADKAADNVRDAARDARDAVRDTVND